MKVVVTIPARNEAKTIGEVVRGALQTTRTVLVMCDRCTDHTASVAKEAGALVSLSKPDTQSLADVFRQEMEAALAFNPDAIVHIDGDGQYSPADMPGLLEGLREAPLVLGNRLYRGRPEGMTLSKYAGNRLLSTFYSLVLRRSIPDITTGYRAFTPDIAMIQLKARYTYTQEQVYSVACKGHKIAFVPVAFFPRSDGNSRLISSVPKYVQRSISDFWKFAR